MLTVSNVSLRYGGRKLFEDVNLKFTPGHCYGVIGANGAGKSTFLRILAGELEPNTGEVAITPGQRLAVLKQDHFAFDAFTVIQTVVMGHARLYAVMQEKDALYAKDPFTDEDGMRAAELETEFAELNGWEAESQAAILLNGLGIGEDLHGKLMADLSGADKVKVLLAQALFGQPDILLLDEPTNHLDLQAVAWLEEFLVNFENTVIVVSHDRHFLNKVCTYMIDIDYGRIQQYVGNYDFWYESSQLALRLSSEANRKKEEKIAELQTFIARFSANASKSKQATSRKKLLEKITLDDIRPSNRKYPFVNFALEREIGNEVLRVDGITKTVDGVKVLENVSFMLNRDDKVALVGNEQAATLLFRILMGEVEPDSGSFKWGGTTSRAYFPKDNTGFFDDAELNLIEWLRQFSPHDQTESYLRGYLGRMLFSGEEVLKQSTVLSGGEKVRCMLARMMMRGANVLVLDEPTNHLDLESIQALNNGLVGFKGALLFTSHDHQFVQTIANRIIEIVPGGLIDRQMTYDEYLESDAVQQQREALAG